MNNLFNFLTTVIQFKRAVISNKNKHTEKKHYSKPVLWTWAQAAAQQQQQLSGSVKLFHETAAISTQVT